MSFDIRLRANGNVGKVTSMQEIRMTYFFLPVVFRVMSNPGGDHVEIQRRAIIGNVEFIRLPIHDAHRFADLLDIAAENATATPVVLEGIGEINGTSVRRLGTGQVRIRLSAKRRNTIRFAIRESYGGIGRSIRYSRPNLAAAEARRFASILRETNVATPKTE